ncbi:MAG: hypothetical protein AAF922_11170 [Pseudomonadota bacterium]
MDRNERRSAPNYTNAALVMGFINLFCLFVTLWALYGLPLVLAVAYGFHLLITRLFQHRRA